MNPTWRGKAKKVSNTVVSNKGTGVISLQFPISNTDGKQKNKKVQLDLMIVDNLWAITSVVLFLVKFKIAF